MPKILKALFPSIKPTSRKSLLKKVGLLSFLAIAVSVYAADAPISKIKFHLYNYGDYDGKGWFNYHWSSSSTTQGKGAILLSYGGLTIPEFRPDGNVFVLHPRTSAHPGLDGWFDVQMGLDKYEWNSVYDPVNVFFTVSDPSAIKCVILRRATPSSPYFTVPAEAYVYVDGALTCYKTATTLTPVTVIVTDIIPVNGNSTKPKLAVNSFHVIQSVPDFKFSVGANHPDVPEDLDLVLNKKTSIQLNLKATDIGELGSTPINVMAKLDDGSSVSASFPLQEASSAPGKDLILPPLVPKVSGSSHLTVTVTADGIDVPKPQVKLVEVKKTLPISLTYFPVAMTVGGATFKPTAPQFVDHISNSVFLMNEMFPVAPLDVQATVGSEIPTVIDSDSSDIQIDPEHSESIMRDLAEVAYKASLDSRTITAGIGIVPTEYFKKHGSEATNGIAPIYSDTFNTSYSRPALVRADYWSTTAHEIAHVFGSSHNSQMTMASGYWFPLGQSLNLPDLMNRYAAPNGARQLLTRWVGADAYRRIFDARLQNPLDPPVMLVGGLLHKNGEIELKPVKYFSDGIISNVDESAEGFVVGVDTNSKVLSKVHFHETFQLSTDDGKIVETEVSPLLVQLPYVDGIETVRIEKEGKVLKEFDPNSQILMDAVKGLTNSDFLLLPKVGKSILVKQAQSVEDIRNFCRNPLPRYKGAWKKDICSKLALWSVLTMRASAEMLLKNTAATNAEDVTRTSLLKAIDIVALHVLPDLRVRARKQAFKVQVVPALGCADRGILKIKDAYSGAFGTVKIVSDSMILYTPNTVARNSDTIRIIVKTSAGDQAQKIVTIDGQSDESEFADDNEYFDSTSTVNTYFEAKKRIQK